MNNRTIRVSAVLIALLFLNIEAAHAGLITRLKVYIGNEFSQGQLLLLSGCLLTLGFLTYTIFAPVSIGSERWSWYSYFTYNPVRRKYGNRRRSVEKIQAILHSKG